MPIIITLLIGLCMVLSLSFLYLSLYLLLFISGKDIRDKDYLVDIIFILSLVVTPSIIAVYFGYPQFSYYIIAYGLIGTLIEFTVGWTYYQLFGARLYRYYKQDLFGFSSIRMFPFWAGASIYFFFIYNTVMQLSTELASSGEFTMILFAGGFIGILLSLVFASIFDLTDRKIDTENKFSWGKYTIFASLFVVGPIAVSIHYGYVLFIYYIIAMITGVILEGMLGLTLRKLYGESFWRYYRLDIFSGQTSLTITPLWLGAISLALIFIYLFL